jgi:putative ATP-binding cassette transporter
VSGGTATAADAAGRGLSWRRLLRLAVPYWTGPGRRAAWQLTAILVAISVAQVFLQLRLNLWSRDFFNAVDVRDGAAVLNNVGVFLALGVGLMAAAAYQIDVKMAVQGEWRRALAQHLIERWLDRATHYHLRFFGSAYDNPDQRIADDAFLVTQSAVDFATGILVSVLLLFGFLGVLWSLSGTLRFAFGGMEIAIPGYLVFAAIVYAVIGTAFAHTVGGPLTAINERRRAAEGDLRAALLRIRDNSESIALLRGEATERVTLHHALDRVLAVWRLLRRRTRQLTWATSAYTIAAPVFPLLIAAPQYLAGELSLGGLMQVSWAFVQIQAALGWFVDNYARLSDWRAGANRLLALDDAATVIARPPEDGEPRIRYFGNAEGVLRLIDLQVATQDGTIMIDRASVEIRPGEKVLIVGESGVGKSTLIRAIAGLWPWGKGTIEWPAGAATMFVPQRDYMPVGSLRAVLAYPVRPENVDDGVLVAALARCGLESLAGRLDDVERWEDALSSQEREQLAFVRLLVHRPRWVFLDEVMSHLDDAGLASIMRIFREELADATVITIEHRPGLEAYHDRTLTLVRVADAVELLAQYRADAAGDGPPSFWRRLVARAREARAARKARR